MMQAPLFSDVNDGSAFSRTTHMRDSKPPEGEAFAAVAGARFVAEGSQTQNGTSAAAAVDAATAKAETADRRMCIPRLLSQTFIV